MSSALARPETKPDEDRIRAWLAEVPDPEIPAISVVDLGVVRDVSWDGDTLVVGVAPTYSGCPAASTITFEIDAQLRRKGVDDLRIERRLSPPWTTDWISEEGREKLRAYGIAPPVDGTAAQDDPIAARRRKLAGAGGATIQCPHCASSDTEMVSKFGSTPCKASYRCRACLEPFDYFKCI